MARGRRSGFEEAWRPRLPVPRPHHPIHEAADVPDSGVTPAEREHAALAADELAEGVRGRMSRELEPRFDPDRPKIPIRHKLILVNQPAHLRHALSLAYSCGLGERMRAHIGAVIAAGGTLERQLGRWWSAPSEWEGQELPATRAVRSEMRERLREELREYRALLERPRPEPEELARDFWSVRTETIEALGTEAARLLAAGDLRRCRALLVEAARRAGFEARAEEIEAAGMEPFRQAARVARQRAAAGEPWIGATDAFRIDRAEADRLIAHRPRPAPAADAMPPDTDPDAIPALPSRTNSLRDAFGAR